VRVAPKYAAADTRKHARTNSNSKRECRRGWLTATRALGHVAKVRIEAHRARRARRVVVVVARGWRRVVAVRV